MGDVAELIARVRERGLRVTRQRTLVLRAFCDLDGHASAEAVHEWITQLHPGVDLSTVYRTLEILRDQRILSETDLGRGCAEYEIVSEQPHHHLVCQACGRVIDLDHVYLTLTAQAIRRDFGFAPVLDHFAIFGLCQSCQKSGQRLPGPCRASERSENEREVIA